MQYFFYFQSLTALSLGLSPLLPFEDKDKNKRHNHDRVQEKLKLYLSNVDRWGNSILWSGRTKSIEDKYTLRVSFEEGSVILRMSPFHEHLVHPSEEFPEQKSKHIELYNNKNYKCPICRGFEEDLISRKQYEDHLEQVPKNIKAWKDTHFRDVVRWRKLDDAIIKIAEKSLIT